MAGCRDDPMGCLPGILTQTADESKRKQIYGEFQEIVAEQLLVFFLVNSMSLQVVRDCFADALRAYRVENVQFSAVGGILWNLDELRLSENS